VPKTIPFEQFAPSRHQHRAVRAAEAAQWERVRPALDLRNRGDVRGALEDAATPGLLAFNNWGQFAHRSPSSRWSQRQGAASGCQPP
jgi:hypothetical protein